MTFFRTVRKRAVARPRARVSRKRPGRLPRAPAASPRDVPSCISRRNNSWSRSSASSTGTLRARHERRTSRQHGSRYSAKKRSHSPAAASARRALRVSGNAADSNSASPPGNPGLFSDIFHTLPVPTSLRG